MASASQGTATFQAAPSSTGGTGSGGATCTIVSPRKIEDLMTLGIDEPTAMAALKRCGAQDTDTALDFICNNDMDALEAEDAAFVARASSMVSLPQVWHAAVPLWQYVEIRRTCCAVHILTIVVVPPWPLDVMLGLISVGAGLGVISSSSPVDLQRCSSGWEGCT